MIRVRELQVGSEVDGALLLRDVRVRSRREGGELITLRVADRSGSLAAVVTENVEAARDACRSGEVAWVRGTVSEDGRFGPRLVITAARPAEVGEYAMEDLLDGPPRPLALLEGDLRELVATVRRPHLAALLAALLGAGTETWARFRDAPAAKYYHQAYRHGLLEHSLTVAQGVSATSATFPGIDRDVAVTGALLHDIGKLDTYAFRGEAIEMTDEGKLYGEIPLGYARVQRAIEAIDGFPEADARAVLHIILSHHGSLEHGSPVVPATREAALVHGMDTLGARLGSFDRVEKALPTGERWSAWDKGLGGAAYFPGVPDAAEPEMASSAQAPDAVHRAA